MADVQKISIDPLPRLRLGRPSSNHSASSQSQAGPSRLPDFTQLVDVNFSDLDGFNAPRDDDQDDTHTPKLSQATLTPAARLRALLSRVPTRNDETPVPPPRRHSPSELDSDFDPPEPVNATPSMAHESLKDIFSRALREPGDTPQKQKQKGRRRSNSYDFSELEGSPRPDKVREKINGKRRSWSDEEVETFHGNSGRTRTPFKSLTKSITLDILRERFTNSEFRDDLGPRSISDNLHDKSDDTSTILQNLEGTTPPAATSTPQQSLRISVNSQFQHQSNLLEQDSEMQHAIEAFDSYEDVSPFSASDVAQGLSAGPSQTVANESTRNSKDHKSSRKSDLNRSSSRSSFHSSQSPADIGHVDEHDKTRERQRDWNRPRTPASPHSPPINRHSHSRVSSTGSQGSYIPTLHHRSSTPSLNFDRESSKGSSFGSQAEYRERIRELERERNIEREREWNKPVSKSGRSSSSLSFHSPISKEHERSRTQSFNNLSRPPSSKSQTPDPHANPSLRRHHSLHSDRGSTSSPTGSVRDHLDEAVEEVVHERERNWNAPRPKWHQHPSHQESSPSASGRFSPIPPSSSQTDHGRVRVGSGKSDTSRDLAQSRISGKQNSVRLDSPRPSSPLRNVKTITPSPQRSKLPTHVSRVEFPSSPSKSSSKTSSKVSPGSSRLKMNTPTNTHTIIQNRQTLSPFDPEDLSPYRRPQPPSSPTPNAQALSSSPPPLHVSKGSPSRLGNDHLSRSFLTPDTKIHDESEDAMSSVEDSEAQSPDRTPTLRTIAPPSPDEAQPPAIYDNQYESSDPSIPTEARPAPASPPPLHSSILSTPPRSTLFRTSPAGLQSPSPPQGLPDLPEPPQSSEDEDIQTSPPRTIRSNDNPNPNWTLMKTPKPPGAWMTTPASPHRMQFPTDSGETESNGGLATPVASLSRGSSLPTRTPAPPGAWDTTYRKSILKVRFDETQDILRSQADISTRDTDFKPGTDSEDSKIQSEDLGRPTTPEPRTPTSPARSPRSVRKSPSIRILDAFGNEAAEDNVAEISASRASPNKSAVRIVDAMGREVNESSPLIGIPLQRLTSGEVFSRVRKGLDGLVQDLNDLDRETSGNSDDRQHISNLEEVSRSARETRQDVSKRMKLNMTEVELIAQSTPSTEKTSYLRWSKLYTNIWFVGGFMVFQFFFALVIFRLSINQARNHFFNVYHDPFYPDIYLTRPDNLHRSIFSTPHMSWLSVIHRHGLKSISRKVLQNIYATLWTTWGSDVDRSVWPPT